MTGAAARTGSSRRGFTLLEVLVAMVLMSVVTLIAAMALRQVMDSWDRGRREGEVGALTVTLPRLLDRQLGSLMDIAPFPAPTRLPFDGRRNGLSFFTADAPRGAAPGGLLRVTCRYEEEEQTLRVYIDPVTRLEQTGTEANPLEGSVDRDREPVSRLEGVAALEFFYSDKTDADLDDDSRWEGESDKVPAMVRLRLTRAGGRRPEEWIFRVRGGRLI
ncbi:MAG: prepilin-type N-terminal cleavage/methylation domain-containing protein [Deltaproteobacteria bacterium]|nr:prepilin-type N-terminal cleavage/methylation domain-containing protein [Candidatus Anaeroferrophillacea bacterium]